MWKVLHLWCKAYIHVIACRRGGGDGLPVELIADDAIADGVSIQTDDIVESPLSWDPDLFTIA